VGAVVTTLDAVSIGATPLVLCAVTAGELTKQRVSSALWGFSWGQHLCVAGACAMERTHPNAGAATMANSRTEAIPSLAPLNISVVMISLIVILGCDYSHTTRCGHVRFEELL